MHIEIPVMSNIGVKYDEGELTISPKELLEIDWNLYEEFSLWEDEIFYDKKLTIPPEICSGIQFTYETSVAKMFWVAQHRDGYKNDEEEEQLKYLTKYYFYMLVSIEGNTSIAEWYSAFCTNGMSVEMLCPKLEKNTEFPDGKEQLELMNLAIEDDNYGYVVMDF